MGIFGNPASGSGKTFNQQRNYIKSNANRASNTIGKGVDTAYSNLKSGLNDATGPASILNNVMSNWGTGTSPVTMKGSAGGLTGGIDANGNVTLNRTGEAQDYMDSLRQGLSTDESAYAGLLGQIAPGFGLLSQSAEQTLQNAKAKSVGDLQAQLAQRRILGSSFANDQVASVANQYDQDIQRAKDEALVQELQMTQAVINDRVTARLNTVGTALNQINYESGIKAQLTQTAYTTMANAKLALADMAKTMASLKV